MQYINFSEQSGDMSFSASIVPRMTIGQFSFGIGGSGGFNVSFSGISGECYDQDGLIVGSFRKSAETKIEASIIGDKMSYFVNGQVARTNVLVGTGEKNWLFVENQTPASVVVFARVSGVSPTS